ncbi:hypothetical protein OIE67_25645 [Nonomuraea fuscirosea]|uniref:hypothetical protein n=1 Tax=Nonomuraea fuscirosea TaxID=1291556 RepID=UPI002DDA6362|nr:hypothetical protein [Nonomuraea fuscirosea]WSA57880.1 hypothetical protein OIE67_25645 [Nonomuraea fuscirosea]
MTEITRADFGEWDWENALEAVYPVMAKIEDISFHRVGDGWTSWAARGDVPALLSEARDILDQIEKPLKEARRKLARIEGTARHRAHQREKRGPDLTGHCIIVETIGADMAREANRPDALLRLGIVECHEGRRGKLCAVQSDLPDDVGIEDAARSIARTYGARYAGVVRHA